MQCIESMYNTQLAAVVGERDALQSQVHAEREKVSAAVTPISFASGLALACVCTVYMISGFVIKLLQAALLEEREASLKEQLAQLDKKLNGMQRVYMRGVKSSVDSIRAGRAALGGAGKFFSSTAGDTDEAQ